MKFRRRYQVVVEGVSGQAAAQRAVLSEHRSEAEARETAALERSRLEVIHGGGARSWRILVMLDDVVVAEELPEADGEDLLEPGRPPPAATEEPADRPGEPPVPPEEPPGAPPEAPEPSPEGPVPDWVIKRFEESIERRGDREGGQPGNEGEKAP